MKLSDVNRCDLSYEFGNVLVAFDEIQLSTGVGVLQLAFRIRLSASWLESETATTPLLVSGRLRSDDGALGILADLSSRVFMLRNYAVSELLEANLTAEQVLLLERGRNGLDLGIQLDLQGALLAPPPGKHPVSEVQTRIKVPASQWSNALDDNGKTFGLAIIVPAPLIESPTESLSRATVASRAQAVTRLREARSDFRDGRYEACVATCRKVLETLALLDPPVDLGSITSKKPRERSYRERWALVYHDVSSLAHLAHHDDGISTEVTWNRADAEAMLTIVASLCARGFD